VDAIVYDAGFKRFAELAREGKLDDFTKDEAFAKEVAAVIKPRTARTSAWTKPSASSPSSAAASCRKQPRPA
jgi:hypothetical protein